MGPPRAPVSLSDYALLSDGFLAVAASPRIEPALAGWLPLDARPREPVPGASVRIHVGEPGSLAVRIPADLPPAAAIIGSTACHLAGARAWVVGDGVAAILDLARREARCELDEAGGEGAVHALSFVTALLLARGGRYLLHCGAAQAPGGGAWLVAGDSRAGKTSTVLGLARTGWGLLSDDHVVLYRRGDRWWLDGWPRSLHPDAGWREGKLTGRRIVFDPREDPSLRRVGTAPLEAMILPRIEAGAERTRIEPASRSEALSTLMRQSAWSLLDPAAAPDALPSLGDATSVPRFMLRLAPDVYRDPARFRDLLPTALRS